MSGQIGIKPGSTTFVSEDVGPQCDQVSYRVWHLFEFSNRATGRTGFGLPFRIEPDYLFPDKWWGGKGGDIAWLPCITPFVIKRLPSAFTPRQVMQNMGAILKAAGACMQLLFGLSFETCMPDIDFLPCLLCLLLVEAGYLTFISQFIHILPKRLVQLSYRASMDWYAGLCVLILRCSAVCPIAPCFHIGIGLSLRTKPRTCLLCFKLTIWAARLTRLCA